MKTETDAPKILAEFKKICEKWGIKLTYQRLEIYRVLLEAKDHPSAEEIFARVQAKVPTISLDTVYRTLATFEKFGLIRKIYSLDERARFDPNVSHHHHLVCVKCHRITDLDWPAVDSLPLPEGIEKWGKIKDRYLELRGLCKSCLKTLKTNPWFTCFSLPFC